MFDGCKPDQTDAGVVLCICAYDDRHVSSVIIFGKELAKHIRVEDYFNMH
jgi:hypothetical protein